MTYERIISASDPDIPYLYGVLKLPEIARFRSIDENNYWNYVTSTENVFYFKVFDNDNLVATTHYEISDKTLYMDIMVIPEYQRKGIASNILKDIQFGRLPLDFQRIEVSIDEINVASRKLFEKMDFVYVSKEDELLNYVYAKNPH